MLIIIFSTIVVYIFFYLGKEKHRRDVGKKFQGPKGYPLIGNTEFFNPDPEKLLNLLTDLQKKFKDYYRLWLGTEFWVVIYEPKLAEKILNNQNLIKANDYEFLKPWLGTGLLTSDGSKWFARRKAITPAFHFNILEDFVESFVKHADIFVEKCKKKRTFDVAPHTLLLTLDILGETALGADFHAQNDEESDYVIAVHNISRILYKRMFNPLLMSDLIFWFTSDRTILNESLKSVHNITQKIIDQKRDQLKKQTTSNEEAEKQKNLVDDLGRKKKMALLDVLLKTSIDGELLADDEVQEEVNTFMFAGHDTTGSSIAFLLYNLAKHPQVQEKVYNEIISVLGTTESKTKFTISLLNDLKYLDLVIKESLRLYTAVPFVSRQILEESEIGEFRFPENTNASIFVYGLCHRDDVFPDPYSFKPERFDHEFDVERQHPFTNIPFSAGPRNCIGQKFAIYEMKTVICRILQNFEIFLKNPDEELVLLLGMILKSSNGIKLKFKQRNV